MTAKMIKIFNFIFLFSLCVDASAQKMSLTQVLQQVIDHYPSVKIAAYQLERAQQENKKVESQLGWQLNSQAGFSRSVSLFGTPTDSLRVSAGMSRKLESGATLGMDAAINRDDASNVFSPTLPNPLTSTSINLNYRHPLKKGADNPAYIEGLEIASGENSLAEADAKTIYDQLASQVIDLYLAAAVTKARINSIDQSILRSKRLKKYISGRLELGVSEEKDILQVNAQLAGQQAEYQGLLMGWQKQKISLNRLMGKRWDMEFNPVVSILMNKSDEVGDALLAQVENNSASLLNLKGQLQLAESKIKTRRDAKEDNLDLVMSIGNRTSAGDTVAGDTNESELVGGVQIEFSRGIDRRGHDTELYQAQIDRGIVLQNRKQVLEDLQYRLSTLLAEIKSGKNALDAYKKSANSEKKKLAEAESRYKKGRADTDQLIQFEAQLSLAELSVDLQQIELQRRYYELNLLTGDLWKSIHTPDIDMKFDQEIIKQ